MQDHAAIGGGLQVGGTLQVGGAAALDGGVDVTGGQVVANQGLDVRGGATLRGGTQIVHNLHIGGNVIANGEPLVKFLYFEAIGYYQSAPLNNTRSTELSADDWNCAVGGIRYYGDIQESGANANGFMQAYTSVQDGVWKVHHFLSSHRNDDAATTYRIGVVCYSTKISGRGDWFNDDI